MNVVGRFIARGCLIVVLGLLLWSLSLPIYIDAIFSIALLTLLIAADCVQLALLTFSLVLFLGIASTILSPEQGVLTTHYREHERFVQSNGAYQRNIDVAVEIPHGDLVAVDPYFPKSAVEPHKIHFRTDSWGNRNDADYGAENQILVGDSFIVGNSTTQEEIFPNALKQYEGIESYSLAHPGPATEYEARANWFLRNINSSVKVAMFFFEGNDFEIPGDSVLTPSEFRLVSDSYDLNRRAMLQKYASFLSYPDTLLKMSRRAEYMLMGSATDATKVIENRQGKFGVLTVHERYTVAPELRLVIDLPSYVWSRVNCVAFIPTKGRVLAETEPTTEALGVRLLKEKVSRFGAEVVDLTPALREGAKEGPLYWRDDTHWNGRGIKVAASKLADCLRKEWKQPQLSESFNEANGVIQAFGESYQLSTTGPAGQGLIEIAVPRVYGTALIGWLIDEAGTAQGIRVIATLNGEIVAQTEPRVARPDVAAAFSPKALLSQFTLNVPFSETAVFNKIRYFALTSSKRARELELPKSPAK